MVLCMSWKKDLLPASLVWSLSLLFCVALMAQGTAAASEGSGRRELPGSTLYPRLIRLAHGPMATRGQLVASTDGVIFVSTDEGRSFTKIATVPVSAGSKHVCCSTLFEVPHDVGALKAGTLLSAGTYAVAKSGKGTPETEATDFKQAEPAAEVYASTDGGYTWAYLATPVQGGPKLPSSKPLRQRGLWEPEFEAAADGSLVMFLSDETDACCSQKLLKIRTRDGRHWVDKSDVIAMPALPDARPGMIVSTPLPDGTYFMSYEICGNRFGCDVYTRRSKDGWDFGDPAATGMRAETASGQFFRHSPVNTYAARAGADGKGVLLLTGQMLYEKDGSVSPENGRVYFASGGKDGRGGWTTRPAPVPVPTAYDNFCPNYSSALLPLADGTRLLELASDYDAAHRCVTYVGSLPLR